MVADGASGKGMAPTHGDLSICAGCTTMLQFHQPDASTPITLKLLTLAEFATLEDQEQSELRLVQSIIQALNAVRREPIR